MTDAARPAHLAPTLGRTAWSVATASAFGLLPLGLGAANGGYFPSSWGWALIAVLWFAAIALGGSAGLSRIDSAFLGAIALFVLWVALSGLWSESTSSLRELERDLLYVAAPLAALLVVGKRTTSAYLGAITTGIGLVASYSLLTRLLPDRLGHFDPVAVYRLSTPLGYWNALGIFCVLGLLLCLGFVGRSGSPLVSALASAEIVVLATTLYFTFSRGASLALGIALVALIAFDLRRLQAAASVLVCAPTAALSVWLSSREHGLTRQRAAASSAAHEGHRMLLVIGVLVLLAAALGYVFRRAAARVDVPRNVRAGFAAVLIGSATLVCVSAIVAYGSPTHIATRAWHSFTAPPPQVGANLNKRLFSLSGNGRADLWRAAWHDGRRHPVVGSGAGSYEQYWLSHRTTPLKVRDAHSLYIEVFGELGILGLILLVTALLVPVAAAFRARAHPLVPFALAAYVAFLVHAGVDWDWEVPAVTLTALLVGCAMLVAARGDDVAPLSPRVRYGLLGAVGLAIVFALVVLVGNMSLAQATKAANNGNWAASAHDAKRAHTWAPWSSEPYRLLGEAQLGEGNTAAAVESLHSAIAKSPDDWNLWFDLARATAGRAQAQALAHATRLNPLSPEIAELKRELAQQKVIDVTGK